MLPGKTLVIGCQSYIGKQFFEAYQSLYPDTLGTHYKSLDPQKKINLLDPDLDALSLRAGEYKWAMIAAANTNLGRCEAEKGRPFRANVEGTMQIVRGLIKLGITPIILSSDYVFDGSKGGYWEASCKAPLNEYGKQKDQLEEMVAQVCGNEYLILRCSKIYGLNRGDNTLIDQIASPLSLGQPIKAAYDQVFAPIYEADVIQGVMALQAMGAKGVFHLCGPEIWSRLDLAKAIGKVLNAEEALIQPISLDDLPIAYKLPKHTYMNCEKFLGATRLKLTSLSSCLKDLEGLDRQHI